MGSARAVSTSGEPHRGRDCMRAGVGWLMRVKVEMRWRGGMGVLGEKVAMRWER